MREVSMREGVYESGLGVDVDVDVDVGMDMGLN